MVGKKTFCQTLQGMVFQRNDGRITQTILFELGKSLGKVL